MEQGQYESRIALERISLRTIDALSEYGDSLSIMLFHDPQPIVTSDLNPTGRMEQRSLIEFLSTTDVTQLSGMITGVVSSLGETKSAPGNGWEKALANFCVDWSKNVLDSPPFEAERHGHITDTFTNYSVDEFGVSGHTAFSKWKADLQTARQQLLSAVEAAAQVDRVVSAADEAEALVERTSRAAGRVGADSLATHFNLLAQAEQKRANIWAWMTAAAGVATALVAWLTLGKWVAPGAGWAAQLVHLAITLPIVGAGVYASKVSSRHREQAWWAATITAQLHTAPAFIAPMTADEQSRVLGELARQVFTHHAPHKLDSTASTELLANAAERIGSAAEKLNPSK